MKVLICMKSEYTWIILSCDLIKASDDMTLKSEAEIDAQQENSILDWR